MKPKFEQSFEVGRRFRVIKAFVNLGDSVSIGDVLIFKSIAYSRYDCAYGYFFMIERNGKETCWLNYDDDQPEVWRDFFEEIRG